MSPGEAGALLRGFPMFEDLSDEQLGWLVGRAEVVSVDEGTVLFREGDPPQHFWVLIEGEIELQKLIGGANRMAANSGTPGVWAGSVPMVDTVHQITARTPRASRLFRISQDGVAAMLANGFPIATHLLSGPTCSTTPSTPWMARAGGRPLLPAADLRQVGAGDGQVEAAGVAVGGDAVADRDAGVDPRGHRAGGAEVHVVGVGDHHQRPLRG